MRTFEWLQQMTQRTLRGNRRLAHRAASRRALRRSFVEVYEDRVLLAAGPFIASAADSPVNLRSDTLDSVDVTFNEAIDFSLVGGSFTIEDVSIAGPDGGVAATDITSLGGNSYRIGFAAQSERGIYRIQVGPDIEDLDGNLMDQDQDGVGGELTGDVFAFSFSAYSADTVFTASQIIASGNTTFDGQDIAVIGATLTANGAHSFDSLQLINGATVTHSAGSVGGLNLTLGDMIVDSTSQISADGRGYAGGQGPGVGGGASEAAGGGGHGGAGGTGFDRLFYQIAPGGAVNDSALMPTLLGSGGGSTSEGPGGAGGGAIRLIVADTLQLDGQITANGTTGSGRAARGGAGGSIWVTTGTLAGSGAFRADGGAGFSTSNYGGGGAGGGGRMAIYYDQAGSFSGFTASTASAGIPAAQFNSLANAGTVAFIDQTVPSGHLHVYTTFATDVGNSSLTFGAITVHSGAIFTMPGSSTVSAGNLTVQATGRITADGLGFAGGQGPGAGALRSEAGGGGGHGGAGGTGFDRLFFQVAPGGAVNDSALMPTLLGSGGGSTSEGPGGAGGGAIRLIVADTLQLDGQITANGTTGSGRAASGGAGGSIWVTTGTLAGSGAFRADGGAGFSTSNYGGGGAGGGGRMAIYYNQAGSFSGFTASTASAGIPAAQFNSPAGAGTVAFIDQTVPSGHLHVYTTFATDVGNSSLTFGAITVHSGAIFTMPGSSTVSAGNLTVQATGRITADGLGFAGGQGPGAGGGAPEAAGGGGHGGTGGVGYDRFYSGAPPYLGVGGSTYGSAAEPSTLGSGGGRSFNGGGSGGAGGGAIRLIVSGTLQVDGQVTAHGLDGSGLASGGGAGGSIWLTGGTVTGTGLICADGGAGTGTSGFGGGGGGGGGRIALYYGSNTFSGTICVFGGTFGPAFSNSGASGTVYQVQTNQPPVADAGGPYSVAEGSTVVLDGSNSSDPDQSSSTLIYQWDLDDDAIFGETGAGAMRGNEIGSNPAFSAAGLDGPSSVVVSLRVTDNGGLTDTGTATIDVTNVAPTITSIASNAADINEGQSVTVSGTFADPALGVASETFSGTAMWSDGVSTAVIIDGTLGTFNTTRFFADDHPLTGTASDEFTVSLTISDDDGGSSSTSITGETVVASLAINPAATYLHVNSDPAPDATPISLASLGIHGGDTIRLQRFGAYHFGNGVFGTGMLGIFSSSNVLLPSGAFHRVPGALATSAAPAGSGPTYFGSQPNDIPEDFAIDNTVIQIPLLAQYLFVSSGDSLWYDNTPVGTYGVTISRLASSATASVTVHNVAPAFDAGSDETLPAPVHGVFSRDGITFTDPGTPDTHEVTVNFGDGSGDQTFALAVGDRDFDLNHTYTTADTFTVSVTVSDDDLGSLTDTFDVTVILNEPPTADAGGPYTVIVGESVQLDASGTSDPDQSNTTLTYEWDLDGDGLFGETGSAAAHGDEVGMSPTFSSLGIAGGSTVTVSLRVTDDGGLSSEDVGDINIAYAPDLTVRPGSITFSPINPQAGELVTISATITNAGLIAASNIDVSFLDFGISLGTVTIASLDAGQSVVISSDPVSFPTESFRLIGVKVDPNNTIAETKESNNQSSQVLQVGSPDFEVSGARIVVDVSPVTACAGHVASIIGEADYDFFAVPGIEDYVVQGAQVTVKILDPGTHQVLSTYTGAHTDVGGHFQQTIIAPQNVGTYGLRVEVTDNTLSRSFETTLTVIDVCPTPPLPTSPPSGGGIGIVPPGGGGTGPGSGTPRLEDGTPQPGDVYVYSEDIIFSSQPQFIGDTIQIIAFVHYAGDVAVNDVPVTINSIFPVGGALQTFEIGTVLVDFESSGYVIVNMPWTSTADGAHIIQVAADPEFYQFEGNDAATRVIFVGDVPDYLDLEKSVTLLVDADGDLKATPGDTLEYTVTYANNGENPLTSGVIFDDFDERFFQSLTVNGGGVIADGRITWDIGTLDAGETGSLSYQAVIKSAAEIPGGRTPVSNTVLLDTDQTPPIGAEAEIEITGDVIPPVTTAATTTAPNAAGWFNTDVTLNQSAADNPGGSGVRQILYSIDGGLAVTVLGDSASLTLTSEGLHTIHYQAIDVVGNREAIKTIQINIDKTRPTVVTGEPFSVFEGSTILLDGSSSTDALSGIASIAWDSDNDGQFDDGHPASFFGLDGPSVHTVSVRVEDLAGNVTIAETEVTVENVAPVITGAIHGPTVGVPGQPLAYSVAGFTDVGTQDTHTTAWTVRDGANAVVATGSGLNLNFTPATAGAYTVEFRVTDDDGGVATTSLALNVGYASLQTGVCSTEGGTALVVGSLTVADRIHVNPQGNDGTLQVTITNRLTDTWSSNRPLLHPPAVSPRSSSSDKRLMTTFRSATQSTSRRASTRGPGTTTSKAAEATI